MMAFFLGQRTYPIGKVQGLRKIVEAKFPFEPRSAVRFRQCPFRDLWFQFLNIRLSYSR